MSIFIIELFNICVGAAYNNPMMLSEVDSKFYGIADPKLTRRAVLDRYIDYCEFIQSDQGPRKLVKNNQVRMVSTSVLLNAMRNVISGVANTQLFRSQLNDLYVDRLKYADNPSPREVIEGAMECLREEDLDKPYGKPVDD